MGITERKSLINTLIETVIDKSLIQYENEQFQPPSGFYCRVNYNPAPPLRVTHGGGHIERMTVSFALFTDLARHVRDVEARAELIQTTFAADTSFAGTGENTRVMSKPQIVAGYPGKTRWIIPVDIRFETLPT